MSETTHLLHGDHPRAWCLCGVNFDFSTRYEQYQDHLYFVREQQIRAMIAQEIRDQQTGSTSTNGRIHDNALHLAARIAKGNKE